MSTPITRQMRAGSTVLNCIPYPARRLTQTALSVAHTPRYPGWLLGSRKSRQHACRPAPWPFGSRVLGLLIGGNRTLIAVRTHEGACLLGLVLYVPSMPKARTIYPLGGQRPHRGRHQGFGRSCLQQFG